MLEPQEIADALQSSVTLGEAQLYGLRVVKVDSFTQFQRDVTLITVEVPNEVLEEFIKHRIATTRRSNADRV